MRLHSLSVTAFGPFADTVEVDLDALAQAQVFLLCGEIGAGKTMLLDAVCFALYGDVPTDRGRARQLRSHFAADGVAPRVVLEVSVGGRRFRFSRSPAWQRAKKRGQGTTTAQPSVLVEELVSGAWTARTHRLDEAGQLVGDLLGMTLPQFSQVVMLPQGQFDTFLRASSEDRQRVLTRLFRTHRFEDVERWLADRRTTLRRSSESRAAGVGAMLHRVSETADAAVPTVGDTADELDDEAVVGWLAQLTDDAEAQVAATALEAASADAAVEAASAAEAAGRRTEELRERHRQAAARAAALADGLAAHRVDVARLEAARRAAAVTASRLAVDRARQQASLADGAASRAVAQIVHLLEDDEPDRESLERRAVAAAERAAVANGFVPRARELAAARVRVDQLTTQLAALRERRAAVAARAAELPGVVLEAEQQLGLLRVSAAEVELHRSRTVHLARRVSLFATMTELRFQVTSFTAKRDAQQSLVLDLRQRLLDVREARLHGMAAELASAMAVGASCPVCGSHDHPAPAVPGDDAVDPDGEQRAQSDLDDAEVLAETHRDQVRSYTARLTVVVDELAGATETDTVTALESTQDRLAQAQQAERDIEAHEQRLSSLRATAAGVAELAASVDADLAVTTEQRAEAQRATTRLTDELAAILGDEQAGDDLVAAVEQQARRGQRAAALLAGARDTLGEQAHRRAELEAASESAEAVAREHGFASVEAATAAELDPVQIAGLEEAAALRVREEAEVAAVRDDPETSAATAAEPVDLDELARRQRLAAEHDRAATTAAELAQRRQRRLAEHAGALRTALEQWRPVREEYAVVRALSELAEGKGPDNPAQVRLSAYVLAARLGQVVAAANERLTRMTDGRYLLAHTAQRGVGERRGGLSLLVQDLWTDGLRDPVTLSGGETFVVSLALALGLADVVTGEAGGVSIDTLFVDEGFGSLDGDTLELVMDTLDELRSGGRVVGVVSHVPELRTRIPAQLVVRKHRRGSRVEQTSAG